LIKIRTQAVLTKDEWDKSKSAFKRI
jgi:hypothetical protein